MLLKTLTVGAIQSVGVEGRRVLLHGDGEGEVGGHQQVGGHALVER